MSFKNLFASKSKTLVGVDIGSSAVKLVALKANGDSYQLAALGRQTLPHDTIVDGVIISKLPVVDAINKLFKSQNLRDDKVATSISGHSVIVKKVTLPEQSEQELDDSIQWEAEQYIPFDIGDVNLDYQIVRKHPDLKKIEIILVAAKRDKISDQTSVLSMAGKIATVVDIDAFSLQNVYEVNYRPEESRVVALLNIGATVMNISIVRGTEFLFTRDMAVGGNHYSSFLQKALHVSYEDAEKFKKGEIQPSSEEMAKEIKDTLESVSENLALEVQKTLDYFKTTTHAEDVQEIYLSGGASRTEGLREHLEQKFQIPVQFLDPFMKIRANQRTHPPSHLTNMAPDYAVAVGLALRTEHDR